MEDTVEYVAQGQFEGGVQFPCSGQRALGPKIRVKNNRIHIYSRATEHTSYRMNEFIFK